LTAQYKKTPLALLGHHVTHLSRQAQKQVCVSLSRLIFLSGKNHFQLVNAFEKV